MSESAIEKKMRVTMRGDDDDDDDVVATYRPLVPTEPVLSSGEQ